MTIPRKFITAGVVCLVFAAVLPSTQADGGAAPGGVQVEPFTPAHAEELAKDFQGVVVEIERPVASFDDAPTGLISLEGLRSIDPEALDALDGDWKVFLLLDGPTTLDAAIAATLVEKPDIEAPPLESLALISDPGGGAHDDFVIPAGERQP